jgi:hypothetical protein
MIKQALSKGPLAKKIVRPWVEDNLEGFMPKLFNAAWRETPNELKIQRGQGSKKTSRNPSKK